MTSSSNAALRRYRVERHCARVSLYDISHGNGPEMEMEMGCSQMKLCRQPVAYPLCTPGVLQIGKVEGDVCGSMRGRGGARMVWPKPALLMRLAGCDCRTPQHIYTEFCLQEFFFL